MNGRRTTSIALGFSLLALFAPPLDLGAQPAPPRPVLELDGTNSYVELPPDVFNGLDQCPGPTV